MSVNSTSVFFKWGNLVSLESVFDRLLGFRERMGLGWYGGEDKNEVGGFSDVVVRAKGVTSLVPEFVSMSPPIDWRLPRENQTGWRLEWRLRSSDSKMNFRFFVDNYPDYRLVPRNVCFGEVVWIGVWVLGVLRFGGRESDEETRLLKEKYDAFKILFQTLECDEAVAAGYYDDAPPEDHRYRYFRLGKTGIQVLTERFESEEIRALATGSYDGKLLLPPETLPQILDSVC